MCGIVGEVTWRDAIDPVQFERMRDTLRHRGPDDRGMQVLGAGQVALGHRRLTIVDLSANGHQPMANEDGTVWVTFNGEIYNCRQLRCELEQRGHKFQSESDSEVLVHGYEEWGHQLVERLKGMFAFGIWDEKSAGLFLARDRFGIKPLYYFRRGDRLVFASELKAIVCDPGIPRTIDFDALTDFLVYRYVPAPKTIWRDIRKLPAAHWLEFKAGRLRTHRYWRPEPGSRQLAFPEAVDGAASLLRKSVGEHLLGDVPVGLFLSGGLDSTLIASQLHERGYPIRSFTIGFQGWERSEHLAARDTARRFSADHHEQMVGEDLIDAMRKLAFHFDEPFGGTSMLPTFALSKLAGQHVKAVLAGDGGDESCTGYHRYDRAHQLGAGFSSDDALSAYHDSLQWSGLAYRMVGRVLHPDLAADQVGRDSHWLYRRHFTPGCGPVKTFQLLDIALFLPEVVLAKVDRASMAHSLEVRVPYLDHEFVEFMLGLDESVYYRPGRYKHLLHQSFQAPSKWGGPQLVKQGFGAPVKRNLGVMADTLRGGKLLAEQIIQAEFVNRLIAERKRKALWALFVLEHWYQVWGN